MRNDLKIAILSLLASLPFGVVTTVAPDYVPFLKSHPATSFWSGATIAALLLAWVLWTALQDQRSTKEIARMIPLVGMSVCGFGFLCFAGWYYSVRRLTDDPASPIGKVSLQYLVFVADLRRSISTDRGSAVLYVKIKNTTPYLIHQRIKASGQINGNTPPELITDEYESLIGPGEERSLSFRRIDDVEFNDKATPSKPTVHGLFSYDIIYWADGYEHAKRRTSKVVTFGVYLPPKGPDVKVGVPQLYETRVQFAQEIEE